MIRYFLHIHFKFNCLPISKPKVSYTQVWIERGGKLGNWEIGKLGNWEIGKLGNWESRVAASYFFTA